ncbi:hypothetical protein MLD38_022979 [Melastoma candidum]|uniref:Uncharacterized protein n=1 Tax=Melastoma candidum TaxID=119954 RepID=A0ACB9QL27_9MYRT|nr:hypothetical protein MLD38_022979 [Melastoma candidum]
MSEWFAKFFQGFMSFPLNIPGTTYHKCLKEHKRLTELLKDILRERMIFGGTPRGDFLDQAIQDIKGEEPLTEDAVIQLMFACLFASTESISNALILLVKMLSEDSITVERLRDEHASILRRRGGCWGSDFSWEEYKSMTFTPQVINETLRLANVAPGIVRRAVQDVQV